jgi:hypothetical protein
LCRRQKLPRKAERALELFASWYPPALKTQWFQKQLSGWLIQNFLFLIGNLRPKPKKKIGLIDNDADLKLVAQRQEAYLKAQMVTRAVTMADSGTRKGVCQ